MQVECEGDKGEERSREAASRIAQFSSSGYHMRRLTNISNKESV